MSAPQQSRSALDYVMLIAAAVIYGAVFSVNKIAANGGAPPLAYAFWQSFGAGLLLWIVLTLRGERLSLSREALISYIVIGALVIGIPISLVFNGIMASTLFGIVPLNPVLVAAFAAVLLLVAFAAAYIPARRAMRLDPIRALRHE